MSALISRRMALRLIGRGAAATGTLALGKGVAVAASEPATVPASEFIKYRVENNFMASAIEKGDLVLLAKEREPVQHRGLYGVPRAETRRFITTAKWKMYADGGIPVPDTEYLLFMVKQGRGPGRDALGNVNKSPVHAILFRCDDWKEMSEAGYFTRHSQTVRTLMSKDEYYLGSFNIEKEHPTAHPIVWVSKQQTGRNWDRDWESYHSGMGAS